MWESNLRMRETSLKQANHMKVRPANPFILPQMITPVMKSGRIHKGFLFQLKQHHAKSMSIIQCGAPQICLLVYKANTVYTVLEHVGILLMGTTYIHTCMHACMHPYIHTYIHTYIHYKTKHNIT